MFDPTIDLARLGASDTTRDVAADDRARMGAIGWAALVCVGAVIACIAAIAWGLL